MKVIIPGGSGLIGSSLARLLISKGHVPVIVSRSKVNKNSNIKTAEWNPYSEELDTKPFEDADAVINLSGYPIAAGRWTKKRRKLIYDSRIITTKKLVSIFEQLDKKPQIFIAGSAVGYYGDRGDEVLDEKSSPGNDFAARVCNDLEQEAVKAEKLGIRTVRIRTGVVLSKSGGALAKMLLPFKMGLGGRLGSGSQYFPWIHETDLVKIFLYCLENTKIGGAVNGVSPGIVTNKEFTRELGKALKRPAVFPVPAAGLKLILGEMSSVLLGSQRAEAKKIIEAGFKFEFENIEDALLDCLRK